MMKSGEPIIILMADDDKMDCRLVRKALEKSQLASVFYTVVDGEELMEYLLRKGKYCDPDSSPSPGVILLDLNMPKKTGLEAIQEIKSHPQLRRIPIVVLTTSESNSDIHHTYELGANSYITKPVTFESLVEVIRSIGNYWFEIVKLPLP